MNENQSENVEQDSAEQESVARRSNSSSNPFDTPFVAPVFLLAMTLWFGYDGWLNPETKSVMFNRVLFGVFVIGFAWTLRSDLKTMRKIRDKRQADADPSTDVE